MHVEELLDFLVEFRFREFQVLTSRIVALDLIRNLASELVINMENFYPFYFELNVNIEYIYKEPLC